jgi:hypothetical protein
MSDVPIVCNLTPAALQARRDGLLAHLLRRTHRIEALPDRQRLHFAPADGLLAEIAAVVDAERQCCRFLQFTIVVAPDEGPITLDLSGPPGAAAFVATLLEG